MNLKYLLEVYEKLDIVNHMKEVYTDTSDASLCGYADVIEQLATIKHVSNDMVIHIEYVDKDFDGTPCEEPYYNVYGKQPDDDDTYALDFMPWGEWLKSEMDDSCSVLDDLDVVCHCLWEMTFHGWEEANIKETIDELNRRVADLKSGKEKGISFSSVEEMREWFDKLIDDVQNDSEDPFEELGIGRS